MSSPSNIQEINKDPLAQSCACPQKGPPRQTGKGEKTPDCKLATSISLHSSIMYLMSFIVTLNMPYIKSPEDFFLYVAAHRPYDSITSYHATISLKSQHLMRLHLRSHVTCIEQI